MTRKSKAEYVQEIRSQSRGQTWTMDSKGEDPLSASGTEALDDAVEYGG